MLFTCQGGNPHREKRLDPMELGHPVELVIRPRKFLPVESRVRYNGAQCRALWAFVALQRHGDIVRGPGGLPGERVTGDGQKEEKGWGTGFHGP